ncbi:Major_facilitator superfamily protein [Hexamita inflata]|uniref:Major facilitator superfamily protein n=1 Tax=Hexamita inflata TaxID=28002 RepID=A0AA86QRJ1_9EUKA|nr:Major facilitator superfamily protein [Hexamita inflata]
MKWKRDGYLQDNLKYRYLIFMQVMGFFTAGFDNQATTMALPEIEKEMHIDVSLSQWVQTISTIAKTSFSIPLAQLGACIGVTNSLMFFTLMQAILFPMLIFVKNFYLFLFVRFLIGLASCGAQVNNSSVYQKLPKEENRKKYAEYGQLTMNTARIFGPLICSTVIQYINWRYVYVVCAFAALSRTINATLLPNFEMKKKSFDYWGALWLILFLSCACVMLTTIAQYYWISSGILFAGSILFFVVFVYTEKKVENPIVDVKVLVKPVPDLMAIQASQMMIGSSESILMPQFFDFNGNQTVLLGIINATRLVINLIGTYTAQKINKKVPLSTLLLSGFSVALVFTAIQTGTVEYFTVFLVFYTLKQLFNAVAMQSLNPTILTSVPSEIIHKVNGLSTTINTLSQCLAQSFIGMLIKIFKEKGLFIEGMYTAMTIIFALIGMNLIQIVLKISRLKPTKPSDETETLIQKEVKEEVKVEVEPEVIHEEQEEKKDLALDSEILNENQNQKQEAPKKQLE